MHAATLAAVLSNRTAYATPADVAIAMIERAEATGVREMQQGDIEGYTIRLFLNTGREVAGVLEFNRDRDAACGFVFFNDDGADACEYVALASIVAVTLERC